MPDEPSDPAPAATAPETGTRLAPLSARAVAAGQITWPDHVHDPEPKPGPAGSLVMTEAYWLFAAFKLFFIFLGLGFTWAGHDIAGLTAAIFMALPLYIVGAFGVPELFFRRRYTFYPAEQRVQVEGFSLGRWRFSRSYRYAEISRSIERRWILMSKPHTMYLAMFHFPDIDVAFFFSGEKHEAEAKLRQLERTLGLAPDSSSPLPP